MSSADSISIRASAKVSRGDNMTAVQTFRPPLRTLRIMPNVPEVVVMRAPPESAMVRSRMSIGGHDPAAVFFVLLRVILAPPSRNRIALSPGQVKSEQEACVL
jgi:hypothetical protein